MNWNKMPSKLTINHKISHSTLVGQGDWKRNQIQTIHNETCGLGNFNCGLMKLLQIWFLNWSSFLELFYPDSNVVEEPSVVVFSSKFQTFPCVLQLFVWILIYLHPFYLFVNFSIFLVSHTLIALNIWSDSKKLSQSLKKKNCFPFAS